MAPPRVSFHGSNVPVGNTDGAWGDITSSVDWCELNYVVSCYVAEWYNTLSSFAMVTVGLLGLCLHYRILERRFLLAFFFVALLEQALCSSHASLKHSTQMCDELPMLYAAFTTTYFLLENEAKPRWGKWLGPDCFARHIHQLRYGICLGFIAICAVPRQFCEC